jgi:hypothetical protein
MWRGRNSAEISFNCLNPSRNFTPFKANFKSMAVINAVDASPLIGDGSILLG